MIPGRLADELATGLMLGLAAGAAVGLIWLGQARVALCLLGGICGGVAGAAMLGTALPFVLRLLRLEPRVAPGPIALAGADVITILLYIQPGALATPLTRNQGAPEGHSELPS
jgi:magnesium transporter